VTGSLDAQPSTRDGPDLQPVRFSCTWGPPAFVGMARDASVVTPSADPSSATAPSALAVTAPTDAATTTTFGIAQGPAVLRGPDMSEAAREHLAVTRSTELHAQ
jgi:hypothetical protein